MEGAIILKGVGLLAFGMLFIWLGISGWKRRREARVSLIEEIILKPADADPLPLNRWDRAMTYVQTILALIFGPAMVFLGLALLFA